MSAALSRGRGPAALEDDGRRFLELTVLLARTDFKVRYYGSALGYLWSLVRPLLFFGILYVVFTRVFGLGKGVPHYPVYLLTGIVLWTFFVETTTASVQCLTTREGLLRKMRFPRLVIPISVALTAMFNLCMNFIAVVVFALANGVRPRLLWLEMPVIILLFTVLATGVGMLLSVLYVRYRDVQPIWDVFSQALFYLSPIIYTARNYRGFVHIALINPIAALLTQMHYAWIGGSSGYVVHSAGAAIGGTVRLVVPLAILFGVFALGLYVFSRQAPYIAENL